MQDLVELLKDVAVPASWLAIPVGLWCLIDSWLLAPRRAVEAGVPNPPDPVPVRIAYAVLPYLVVGGYLFVRHVVPWLVVIAVVGSVVYLLLQSEKPAPTTNDYGAVEVVGLIALGLGLAWGAVTLLDRYHSKR